MSDNIIHIACDESNNGKSLEIHTAVASVFPNDVYYIDEILSKRRSRRAHRNIFDRVHKRDYRFLLFHESDKERYRPETRLGIITASLSNDLLTEEHLKFFFINFVFDGEKSRNEIEYARRLLRAHHNLGKDQIGMSYGAKYDQHYALVNIADQLAHYFFKKRVSEISEHPKRSYLLNR